MREGKMYIDDYTYVPDKCRDSFSAIVTSSEETWDETYKK